MKTDDKKKAEQAHDTLKTFTGQFGDDDLCKLALLDVILETIYGESTDNLDIPSKTGQEPGEDSGPSGAGDLPTYKIT